MRFYILRLINLLIVIQFALAISCEKADHEYTNDHLIIKSQQIPVFIYDNYCGVENYNIVIPCKLHVKGGNPNDKGDGYIFSITDSTLLQSGLFIDETTGVIFHNSRVPDTLKQFEVEVTDGSLISKTTCYINTQFVSTGSKIPLPVFQFSSPETNLIYDYGTKYLAVAFGVMGGKPPYYFGLSGDSRLPGKLALNPATGLISGDISMLEKGIYTFRLTCLDNEQNLAISFLTAEKYEEFSLIIQ